MLTGTPLDLTPFGPILSALGIAYLLLALGLTGLALWLPKRSSVKLAMAAVVVVAFVYPMLRHLGTQTQQRDGAQSWHAAAMAFFAERCKSAGEKITRTVDNVDGVVWMKWREKISNADNFADQWKLNDPYGQDCGAEDCISNLLRVTKGAELNPGEARRHSAGYRFVETVDPGDGLRYRYTAHLAHGWTQEQVDRHKSETGKDVPAFSHHFKIDRVLIEKPEASYGITWEDISTRDDREHWIAGGSLKVIHLQTKEVIAERIGYMIDQGQGSQAGFRSPWLFAVQTACPEFPHEPNDSRRGRTLHETQSFAIRVLIPTKGE